MLANRMERCDHTVHPRVRQCEPREPEQSEYNAKQGPKQDIQASTCVRDVIHKGKIEHRPTETLTHRRAIKTPD